MKNLSVVVVNYVSSGKTALARQLLQPRLDGAPIISVETINKDEGQSDALKAEEFRKAMQVVDALQADDKSVVLDVGVSNVELLLAKMRQEKAFADFDYFLVPITPDRKTMQNSIALIEDLATKYNVPAKKILVVFNRAPYDTDLSDAYGPIMKYHADLKRFKLVREAVVHESEVFDLVGVGSLLEVSQDQSDLRAAMRAATTDGEKIAISNARALRKMSVDTVAELDSVFDALFEDA